MTETISIETVANKIFVIRGLKVMLDKDLAGLYGVETKRLKEQVRRNIQRFPEDFMFELTKEELQNLRSQIATSSWGGSRYSPMAFTEQGVAMLSSVLKSDRAIEVNIQIMRVFTKLRQILLETTDLKKGLAELRDITDSRFQIVFETLDQLLAEDTTPKHKIGFNAKEKKTVYKT